MQQSMRKTQGPTQSYSISFVAALSQTKVVSSYMIEGTFDSTLFENYMY